MRRTIVNLGAGLLTLFGAASTAHAYTAEWSVTGVASSAAINEFAGLCGS